MVGGRSVLLTSSAVITFLVMLGHEFGHWLVARALNVRAVIGVNYRKYRSGDISTQYRILIEAAGPAINLLLIVAGFAASGRWDNLLAEIASLHRMLPLFAGVFLSSERGQDEYRLAKRMGRAGTIFLAVWLTLLSLSFVYCAIRDTCDFLVILVGFVVGSAVGRLADKWLRKVGYL
jgi:hypothetical protein